MSLYMDVLVFTNDIIAKCRKVGHCKHFRLASSYKIELPCEPKAAGCNIFWRHCWTTDAVPSITSTLVLIMLTSEG